MRRYTSWTFAVAVAMIAGGFVLEAAAQVVDMTRSRVGRCDLHRTLGSQLPPECGGTAPAGPDVGRGRVQIGGGQQPQQRPGTAPTAPTATTPPGQPTSPAPTADRPRPTRDKPYGAALPIPFEFNSDRLTAAGMRVVDQLAEVLKLNGQDKFIIQGHTDAIGGDDYNKALSERRAQAVADYLVEKHGIARDRLETQGLGKSSLLLPADPNNGRNRRVQVLNVGG
jgi:outer membrane protein OmpA-like peptidoglycan-associated protein